LISNRNKTCLTYKNRFNDIA